MLIWFIYIIMFLFVTRKAEGVQQLRYSLSANYNKQDSPGELEAQKGKPFIVRLKLGIQDIISVNEFEDVVQLDILITRMWLEPRIIIMENQDTEKDRRYPVDESDVNKLWVPDFYVMQMRSFTTNQGKMDLSYLFLMIDNTILQVQRVNLVLKCKFQFELYPMDVQNCEMDFMNPLDPAKELVLQWWWERPPVAKFKQMGDDSVLILPKYVADLEICRDNFITEHVSGNVSAVRIWLILKRQLMDHILETYVPTGLFVAMSWGSFLVKPDIVPGRMVLLVTNLLSLVTLFESSRLSAPPAVGIKFVDIWLISCIGFVFLALLEYAIILCTLRKSGRNTTPSKSNDEDSRIKNLKLFSVQSNFIRENPIHMNIHRTSLHPRRKITLRSILKRMVEPFIRLREMSKLTPSGSDWNILDKTSLMK
ncbi:hypothetical protein C0J52_18473 [Blattella germanica]|nr:hypothetical protein C0J52_18473 [Blattella germanica]